MRAPLLLLALLTLTPLAAAGDIVGFDPIEGAYGTTITITGIGFGTAPAKVTLTTKQGKPRKLKVFSTTDTTVVAELRKAPAGSYTVVVRPKGGEDLAAVTPFVVRAPELVSTQPIEASPGVEVELFARFLGTKKGKVKVGGLNAKVLSWEAPFIDEGKGATDRAVVQLSKNAKKTPNGPASVELIASAGSGTSLGALTLTGGELFLYQALVDGQLWVSKSFFGFPGYFLSGSESTQLFGVRGKPGQPSFEQIDVAVAGFDPTTFAGKLPLTLLPPDVLFTYTEGVGAGATIWTTPLAIPEGEDPPTFLTITGVLPDGTITGFGQSLGMQILFGEGPTKDVTQFQFSIGEMPDEIPGP